MLSLVLSAIGSVLHNDMLLLLFAHQLMLLTLLTCRSLRDHVTIAPQDRPASPIDTARRLSYRRAAGMSLKQSAKMFLSLLKALVISCSSIGAAMAWPLVLVGT